MSKVIFITGTSTGIGKVTAITLAKAGYKVIAAMRGTENKNLPAARELSAIPNIEVVELEITSDESVNNAVAQVLSRHGKIDVLVNNAAVTGFGIAEAYTIDTIKRMFEVNFYGIVRAYQAVLPSMREAKDGLVINLSTGASGFSAPYMAPYYASKFAMEAWVEAIQAELEFFSIENVSLPIGVFPTGMIDKGGFSAEKVEIIKHYEDFQPKMEALGKALFGKVVEFNMDPQMVADGIQQLIEMKKGSRPLRFPIDAIAQGTDQEFIDARAAIKSKWGSKYGFDF
jgi:NAD(P)-dependent dehydrogenase (short-subunit alcohol dehydrogenase family)